MAEAEKDYDVLTVDLDEKPVRSMPAHLQKRLQTAESKRVTPEKIREKLDEAEQRRKVCARLRNQLCSFNYNK